VPTAGGSGPAGREGEREGNAVNIPGVKQTHQVALVLCAIRPPSTTSLITFTATEIIRHTPYPCLVLDQTSSPITVFTSLGNRTPPCAK